LTNVVPDTLEGQFVWLVQKVADLERRSRNRKRLGKIVEVNAEKGVARVQLSESDDNTPYLTPWIPWREHSAGAHKTHYPPSVGEQVYVTSENGDMTEGEIDRSMNSTANPRPSKKGDEFVLSEVGKHKDNVEDGGNKRTIKVGGASIVAEDSKLVLSVGGSSITIEGGKITIKSAIIEENP
jgi:phage baseplate assembly protein V